MSRHRTYSLIVAALVLALAGCGAQPAAAPDTRAPRTGASRATAAQPLSASSGVPRGHPQALEPAAGVQAAASSVAPAPAPVGDPGAHAPSLSQVKQELQRLNLCGGTTNSANAAPVVKAAGPGFVADPGTSQTEGQLPVLTAQLNAVAKALGVTIYGISGYRTPAQSVAVGGYADDPHTKGEAEDIGVNSLLRSSAAQISEAELAAYGLYRPFDPSDDPNNPEVNHIQLIPSGGPLSVAHATTVFDPDPSCG
ncbi:MAG: hypothetical protein JOZ64_07435 [Solirubrobacterales bacterium]|nr:hypothetical protein [Solirubrobacterales bacterium]